MSKTFDRSVTEDLTSEVFVTAFEQFNQKDRLIEDKEKYLYGVMKLTWTQYLRRKYADLAFNVESIEDFEQFAVQTVREVRERSLIDRALPYIEKLPEKQKAILTLRFRDGMSLSEICEATGHDMNYVKTTQKRGLASLTAQVKGVRL